MSEKKGILTVISGPSGSGKGTVLAHVLKNNNYKYSISATTRQPREGEKNGVHYFFLTKEEFEQQIAAGGFLEHAEYCQNYYGTPKEYVEKLLAEGKHVILEIETEGAFMVKENVPEAMLVFIAPPDIPTLEKRLRGRGTEDEETIQKRLARAKEEIVLAEKYDYCVVNNDNGAEKAAEMIIDLIETRANGGDTGGDTNEEID